MRRAHFHQPVLAFILLFLSSAIIPLLAQDDVTTQNGSSGYNGSFITGPASNPLSFLNGPAYRTTGQNTPYDFPDFAPMTALDQMLPSWISSGWKNVSAQKAWKIKVSSSTTTTITC